MEAARTTASISRCQFNGYWFLRRWGERLPSSNSYLSQVSWRPKRKAALTVFDQGSVIDFTTKFLKPLEVSKRATNLFKATLYMLLSQQPVSWNSYLSQKTLRPKWRAALTVYGRGRTHTAQLTISRLPFQCYLRSRLCLKTAIWAK